jgi:hypothetical protein
MKHIEKIIINNARRLGKNVEIIFGNGATIILAPNGIGKTTIFEAIELALTGQIKRLENSPDAIIRDGLAEMDVRLDFSEGKYCLASYRRGGNCKRNGDYEDLFKIESQSSLPYLFRLTHFLEQRSNQWFIDKKDKDAGDILSKLPLGKELHNILSKKQGLLTAIGKTETTASDNLSEAQKKLSEFEVLITRRDSLATEATLTPLNEILAEILSISKLIDYEDYKDETNLIKIISYFEKARVSLQQEKDKKIDLNIRLNALKERTQLYISNLKLLTQKQAVISEHSLIISTLSPIIEQTKKDLQTGKEELFNLQNEIIKVNSSKSMFEEIDQQQSKLNVKKPELEQKEYELTELQKSYETTIEYLKKNERIRDQHRLIEDSINEKKNLLNQIESKRDFQKQWQNLSDLNKEILEIKIPTLEKKKNDYQESKSRLDKDFSEAENEYLIKKSNLESLNEASGAIQDAVSTIRKNLADNQKSCPVCQAVYEPEDLVKRIENSLNSLNPAIPHAIEEEKKALENLEKAREKQSKENQRLQDTISELNTERNRFDANHKVISESYQPRFPGLNTPKEAHFYIEEQIKQITSEITELETNKSQLEPQEDSNKIDNAKLKKNEDERSISDLNNIKNQLQNDIDTVNQRINTITESLDNEQKDSVLNTLSNKMIEEKEMINKINDFEASLLKNEAELKEHQDSCLLESEAISKIKGIQDSILAEWEQAGLDGQPNQEALGLKLEVLKKSIDELENSSISSNKIEQELANWRAAEKFEEINDEVKKLIGDVSEETHIKNLETSVSQKSSILQNVTEKRKAVKLFLDNIKDESEKIHGELDAINEPWKGLLKRIVINPLIANAPLLSNKTLRNKLTAKTSAVIHDKNTDIADIASEAQLTDLQLTFMLAMANRYQWTPWKALLLDDPTQHHDLVHAASVFDVLRDYIIEFDYQVMMSTHDSIQAKFFQRKLENEGVPSKIYQLVDRSGGVTAERII